MPGFPPLDDDAKNELWASLALRHAQGIGPRRAKLLVEAYGSAFDAVDDGLRSPGAWAKQRLVPAAIARDFATESWRTEAGREWRTVRACGCRFLLWKDPDYPSLLREIPDAPLLLYYAGDLGLLSAPSVAVVGARDCTREGIAVAAHLSRGLAQAGVTVISGMAKGIDRAAHLAGLEGPGKSIAVLGTGIDVPYPAGNVDLHALLLQQGLVVSEFAPGVGPSARHFPIRNRLISGLSHGVLVVEAADRSGSLITARLALEQNREVFAVPGHTMAAVSKGCQELIRKGAKAVFTADDVLSELAPLLTATAREALEKRTREADAAKNAARSTAQRRKDARDTACLAEASDVLPKGGLPWETPPAPKSTSFRSVPHAPTAGGTASAVHGTNATDTADTPYAIGSPDAVCAKQTTEHRKQNAPNVPLSPPPQVISEDERRILSALEGDLLHIDILSRRLDMDAGRLSGVLTFLEVRGLVRRAPGMLYSLPDV